MGRSRRLNRGNSPAATPSIQKAPSGELSSTLSAQSQSSKNTAPQHGSESSRKKSILRRILTQQESVIAWVFRVFTLLSVGYIVFDRYYETSAVISSPASDPEDPFYFPFSLTNISHIFPLRNLNWGCRLIDVKYEGNNQISNSTVIERVRKPIVPPGGVSNIYCNRKGIKIVGMKMNSATVQLQAEYDVDVFGFYLWRRQSELTHFTWMAAPSESRRQWIKGDP